MMLRHSFAVALACAVGLALGSCTPFSGYVADHWPHFAGGEPDDLPPRPGTPGYNRFISHGQPAQSAATPAVGMQPPTAGATGVIAMQRPAAAGQTLSTIAEPPVAGAKPDAQLDPAVESPANDPSVVQGGLY